ncbi:MAG: universal stress protein [Desulfomonilaceae bacterium]
MFKRILFPTKFDEFSLEILKSIVCLKSGGLKEVVLLHVIDIEKPYSRADWGGIVNLTSIQKAADEQLASYAEYLQSEGIQVKATITTGPVVSEILRIANEEEISLIVAGRQKRSILGDLFIGSTTDRIIRQADLPVLVTKYHTLQEVKGELIERFCFNLFQKILYPVDWSPWTERVEKYLPSLLQAGASEIIAVHVAEDLVKRSGIRANEAQESIDTRIGKLQSLERSLRASGFQAKTYLLEEKSAYRAINRIATEEDVTIIVMGSQGKGHVEGIIWGSVSQRVVEYSERPVLVVK